MKEFDSLAVGDVFSVRGKRVVLTGAAGDIGSAIARVFAQNGAELYVTDNHQPRLDELSGQLEALGATARARLADLRSPEDMKALAEDALAFFNNRVDGFIHCGGLTWSWPLMDEDDTVFDAQFQTNVRSFWMMARGLLPAMRANGGGSMVVISSVHGHRADAACPVYAASKAALMSMAREIAGEFGGHNIRVNSVSPGWILADVPRTAWPYGRIKPEHRAEVLKRMVKLELELIQQLQNLPHPGRPEDVAFACLYLMSDAARFVTGTDLLVDGGKMNVLAESRFGQEQMRRRVAANDAIQAEYRNIPMDYWLEDALPSWYRKK